MIKKHMMSAILLVSVFVLPVRSDEGMIPLSELGKLDLKSKGLRIDPQELYNPAGISLVNGIINLSGCTASFVSPDGLILTNYHCAFGAIQDVTTAENDYMADGFSAVDRGQELEAKGYTVRVIDSYQDVSARVLKVVKKGMGFEKRAKAVEKRIKEIILEVEKKNPGKRADVAEMFIGKTYVLFLYTYIRDVRLVYAPPRSIGEYGGEEDNWMWPRHTGDFAFLRAYVAPDGSSAGYSPDNVPYKPARYLEINPKGVNGEDFVFVPGYPGRTYRHRTSAFIAHEENLRMPSTVDLYGRMIGILEALSESDRETAIRLSPLIKGLWNTKKNYMGKLKGLKALKIADSRRETEDRLQAFIDLKPGLKRKYGRVLPDLRSYYRDLEKSFPYEFFLTHLLRNSRLLQTAYTVYEASIERKKKDADREPAYMDRNFERTRVRLFLGLRNYVESADRALLTDFLKKLDTLGGGRADKISAIFKTPEGQGGVDFADHLYKRAGDWTADHVESLFKLSREELEAADDPLIRTAVRLYPLYRDLEKTGDERKGKLDGLLSELIEVRKVFLGKEFIPDANSTFRLTYGFVRGYSPADGMTARPFTTVAGIIEKDRGREPFHAPEKLIRLHRDKQFGNYANPSLNDVPVAMLYNLDTTGGNSGSPVLDADGKLVGLNFDRVYEATINDYAWDERYSRSIGVDIRFILWFVEQYGEASHLIREMLDR